jgi:hypothetical protein
MFQVNIPGIATMLISVRYADWHNIVAGRGESERKQIQPVESREPMVIHQIKKKEEGGRRGKRSFPYLHRRPFQMIEWINFQFRCIRFPRIDFLV